MRCDLTAEQLEAVSVGQPAEVIEPSRAGTTWAGRVVSVSLAADPTTGRVPALLRLDNAREQLRCYVNVRVRFASSAAAESP